MTTERKAMIREFGEYAREAGEGGMEQAMAIAAAFTAGLAAGKASAEKKEKPAAEAESDKKEG